MNVLSCSTGVTISCMKLISGPNDLTHTYVAFHVLFIVLAVSLSN